MAWKIVLGESTKTAVKAAASKFSNIQPEMVLLAITQKKSVTKKRLHNRRYVTVTFF